VSNVKKILIITVIVVMILVGGVFVFKALTEEKPLNSLSASDISEVTVSVNYYGTVLTLDEHELNELVEILRKVVIYDRVHSDRYAAAGGQNLTYNISKTDGDIVTITEIDTDIISIDGVGYRAKVKPLGELQRLSSRLEWDKR